MSENENIPSRQSSTSKFLEKGGKEPNVAPPSSIVRSEAPKPPPGSGMSIAPSPDLDMTVVSAARLAALLDVAEAAEGMARDGSPRLIAALARLNHSANPQNHV